MRKYIILQFVTVELRYKLHRNNHSYYQEIDVDVLML